MPWRPCSTLPQIRGSGEPLRGMKVQQAYQRGGFPRPPDAEISATEKHNLQLMRDRCCTKR